MPTRHNVGRWRMTALRVFPYLNQGSSRDRSRRRLFRDAGGKVAHGLVRGGDRFTVRAVVDHTLPAVTPGELVTGIATGVPIVSTSPRR